MILNWWISCLRVCFGFKESSLVVTMNYESMGPMVGLAIGWLTNECRCLSISKGCQGNIGWADGLRVVE